MRSQYSRSFLFAVAASLLASSYISSKLTHTFELLNENSGIYADFSALSSDSRTPMGWAEVSESERTASERKIESEILESRALALNESPVLLPVQAVREIYGPNPYRWVRVRFDQNRLGLMAVRSSKNWIRVARAKPLSRSDLTSLQVAETHNEHRTTHPIHTAQERESFKLAQIHAQISKLSNQLMNTQNDEIETDSSSVSQPPIPVAPVQIVQSQDVLIPEELQNQASSAAPVEEAELDAVPTVVSKTHEKLKKSELNIHLVETKPSVVSSIKNKIADVFKPVVSKALALSPQEHKIDAPSKVDTQYEPVTQNQSHPSDLDNHIRTIEYSDLPAGEAPKLAQLVRVEEEQAEEEVKAEVTAKQEEQPKVAAAEKPVSVEAEETEEEKVPDGPLLVSGFNSTIRLSQSSTTTHVPALGELVEKVNRLRKEKSQIIQSETQKQQPVSVKKTEEAKRDVAPREEKPKSQPVLKLAPVTVIDEKPKNIATSVTVTMPTAEDEISVSQSAVSTANVSQMKKTCDTALIGQEAFSTVTSQEDLISVCRRPLSLEGGSQESGSRWWEVRESVNHWPTIIRQKTESALKKNERIPVLSLNTVKILSTLSKSQTQSKAAGIIVGEVPPGIQVSLSGRSDPVIYFDSHLQIHNAQDTKVSRYFTFLNVEPGLPLLNVSLKSGNGSGTIALLVQSGAATYIRVPSPRLRKMSGTVYSAKSAKALPVAKANLQVVGQSGKQVVTDKKGNFEINNVLTFDDHPLYLDVSSGSREFKHRYRIIPDRSKGLVLFRFDAAQVSNWVQQLEGGVSPMSGLIVGALPGLFTEKESKTTALEVKIGTLDRKSILRPEVYGLGAGDLLQDSNHLDVKQTRFLSVQVPEGPNVPSAFDAKGNMIWSETVYAQPGVINVVGR